LRLLLPLLLLHDVCNHLRQGDHPGGALGRQTLLAVLQHDPLTRNGTASMPI
jgi:hypothetical protein